MTGAYSPFQKFAAALSLVGSVFPLTDSLQAQTSWQGDVSAVWQTSGNWSAGTPGTTTGAIFDDSSVIDGITTFMPFTDTTQRIADSVTFNTGGWTIGTDGDGYVNLRGTAPNALISNGAGINIIGKLRTFQTANVTTGSGNTLRILDSNGGLSFITKSGEGTLDLAGTATLQTAIPDVTAGTLLINSVNYSANSDTRTISSGATLGGSGTLDSRGNNDLEFVSGSTFAPGTVGIGDTSAGTFTIDASQSQNVTQRFNIHLQSGSTFAIDIFGDGSSDMALFSGVATNTSTRMTIENNVTLALSGTPQISAAYRVAEFTGAGEYDNSFGTFDFVTLNGLALTEGVDYTMSYVDHTAFTGGTGYIEVTVLVPEPSTVFLLTVGLGSVLTFRRRKV